MTLAPLFTGLKICLLVWWVAWLPYGTAHSQEEGLQTAEKLGNQTQLRYNIQLHNQELYTPESTILIRHTITNDSAEQFLFHLANDRIFNIGIEAQTEGGTPLEEAELVYIRLKKGVPILYREITLAPGEAFSFIESLKELVRIEQPGDYIVRSRFYPTLVTSDTTADTLLSSGSLRVTIRPSIPPPIGKQPEPPIPPTPLNRQDINPDEVVRYLLDARIDEDWGRFFLYLNVTSIYRALPDRDRIFTRLAARNQLLEIEKFRTDLQRGTTKDSIALQPLAYTVIETSYNNDRAQVVAELQFRSIGRGASVRRYVYFLRRDNASWEIYDYTVQILGATGN